MPPFHMRESHGVVHLRDFRLPTVNLPLRCQQEEASSRKPSLRSQEKYHEREREEGWEAR